MPPAVDADRLAAACSRGFGTTMAVEGLRRLSGGASRETWAFHAVDPATGARHALVLRRDPGPAITGGTDRDTERRLLEVAAAHRVPVPRVRFGLTDDDGLGSGFVMDHVAGETIPRKILRDEDYASARPLLAAQCGRIAAAIHAIPTTAAPGLSVQWAADQLEQYRRLLDGFGEPHPAFELALRWLEDHRPDGDGAGEPRVVHGDFRNGNLIVGSEGVRAVLDWELAHLGDPIEDLGWLCVRSWRFGALDRVVGGFGQVDELIAAYREAGGREVDPDHVRYWEVLGTLKWGVICLAQCETHRSGLVRSVELAALGRRVAETEWDLLELVAPEATGAVPSPASGDETPAPIPDAPLGVHDRPSAAELVDAVREYLERDVKTGTTGRVAFHARVAANVLAVVARELREDPAVARSLLARACAVVGEDVTPADALARLSTGIRDGSLAAHADVVPLLRDLVRAKLAVAAPHYAARTPT